MPIAGAFGKLRLWTVPGHLISVFRQQQAGAFTTQNQGWATNGVPKPPYIENTKGPRAEIVPDGGIAGKRHLAPVKLARTRLGHVAPLLVRKVAEGRVDQAEISFERGDIVEVGALPV